MENKYSKLFERISINGMDLRNRFALAPMGTFLEDEDGLMCEKSLRFFEERAKGGAALIFSEIQWVNKNNEGWLNSQKVIDTPAQTKSWYWLAERVHAHGSKLCIQLSPGLGKNAFLFDDSPQMTLVKSASVLPMHYRPDLNTVEMTREEIKENVECFRRAAQRVLTAEADAIEIHAHVGYMLDQFMSSQWNHRTDEYGGSFENRMRFITEIYQAIRDEVGPRFPILVRLSLDHMYEGGRKPEESIQIAKYLESIGVDALDIDVGSYEKKKWVQPSYYAGDGPLAYASEMVKKAVSIPVLNAGSHTPDSALDAVENGKADIIMMARALIADPELPNKVFEGRTEDIRPCMRCNRCLDRPWMGLYVRCAGNVQATAEEAFTIRKTDQPKNVVVVGGGPGGMEAARVAALKGHHVKLYEMAPVLGGQLIPASAPSFKYRLAEFMKYHITQLGKTGVEVHLNTAIDENSPELENADVIIVATGAVPFVPNIKGIENKNVIEVTKAHENWDSIKGQKIVVAGGGMSGCDAGIELAMNGRQVTIIEMQNKIAPDEKIDDNRSWLNDELNENHVTVLTGHKITEIKENGVVAVDSNGEEKFIEADTVIAAFGMRPNSEIAQKICNKYQSIVRLVGDCEKIRTIEGAERTGFFAGWGID